MTTMQVPFHDLRGGREPLMNAPGEKSLREVAFL